MRGNTMEETVGTGRAAERFVNFARRWTADHPDVNRSLIEDF